MATTLVCLVTKSHFQGSHILKVLSNLQKREEITQDKHMNDQ